MAPWLSAPQTSSGTSCNSCAASSDLRRMNPTCGPLPWLMATSQPSLIIDAMCQHVSPRSEEHTSELQSHSDLVCRLLLEKKKKKKKKKKQIQQKKTKQQQYKHISKSNN